MQVSHSVSAVFDDLNLVSAAGLAPVLALAERAGLHQLVAEHLTVPGSAGANTVGKGPALVAGMVAGAAPTGDMHLLRHGGMGRLFSEVRAPTTLGTCLRGFRFGHVRQLDAVASRLLIALSKQAPLLAGADQVAYLDIDDTMRETHGYAKQGVGYGYSKVKGLNALLAIVSTPIAAPVIAGTRLRTGSTNSARGAARLITDALLTARKAGATGMVTVRADSAYYGHDVVAAARRSGAHFSITARMDPAIRRAITTIGDDAWVTIKYPNAIYDEDEGRWISDAEVAEIPFTAFTSRRKAEHITARRIVRRVKRLNPASVPAGQSELFAAWRPHAVFTDSPLPMLDAEAGHRDHALAVAARLARSARRIRMHLPRDWPWESAWTELFISASGPPAAAACPPSRPRREERSRGGRAGQTGCCHTPTIPKEDHQTEAEAEVSTRRIEAQSRRRRAT